MIHQAHTCSVLETYQLTNTMNHYFTKQSSGFTLIELLVVMVIIGVLAGVLLPNMLGMRQRARDSQVKSEMAQLKTALQLYYSDFQKYPVASGGQMMGCGSGGTGSCTWGELFSATQNGTNREYMKQLPQSKKTGGVVYYEQPNGDQTFRVGVDLEIASDKDISDSVKRCGIGFVAATSTRYYICS